MDTAGYFACIYIQMNVATAKRSVNKGAASVSGLPSCLRSALDNVVGLTLRCRGSHCRAR